MKVLSIVGARPQFIKAALLSHEFAARRIDERLVHTGQHYDPQMSDVFFRQLNLPDPHHYLGVGSASHAVQTAQMMMRLEPVIEVERPDCVLVYGDTNSTLAGALVAAKARVPLVHVEAGLRSFDMAMPEEANRVVVDHLSRLLLAPTWRAAAQLRREGITSGVEVVGDLMVDLALSAKQSSRHDVAILEHFGLRSGEYAVATIHRAANTEDPVAFARLIAGLRQSGLRVVFPVHPRTRRLTEVLCVGEGDNIVVSSPLSYHDMLVLQMHARVVVTDSGGMQKEAVILGTPCVTLRDTTEWTETLEGGWNVLVGSDPGAIAAAAQRERPRNTIQPFGSGNTASRIADVLLAGIRLNESVEPCAS